MKGFGLLLLASALIRRSTVVSSSSSSAAPWQDFKSGSVLEDSLYAELPPNVFTPSGRLPSVERLLDMGSDGLDQSSTLVVAIHCRDGIAMVATLPRSPYLYDPEVPESEENVTNTTSLWLVEGEADDTVAGRTKIEAPFCRLGPTLFGVTGGNAVDSQVLRDFVLHDLAQSCRDSGLLLDEPQSARLVARRLADKLQVKTQLAGKGRLLASTAILADRNEMWRIDPTGQLFLCSAAVAGRAAKRAEERLLEALMKTDGSDSKDDNERWLTSISPGQVRTAASAMTMDEAMAVAVRAVASSLDMDPATGMATTKLPSVVKDDLDPPTRLRFRGMAIPSESANRSARVREFSQKKLLAMVTDAR